MIRKPLYYLQSHRLFLKQRLPQAAWLMALSITLPHVACVRHVHPYSAKARKYMQDNYAAADAARTPGSLWSEGSHNLFEDQKARRVGDILTIIISEEANATRDAATRTHKDTDLQLGISAIGPIMAQLSQKNPNLDSNALIAAISAMSFDGGGNTSRSGKLRGTLPVRIKQALPNGDFYVEGNKVLLLNDEESFLYISGVVRAIDIAPNNTVNSSALADVELEYSGRGNVTETDSPGWFTRILNIIWPF